jgi:hypothetical protein
MKDRTSRGNLPDKARVVSMDILKFERTCD